MGYRHCPSCGHWRPDADFPTSAEYDYLDRTRQCDACRRGHNRRQRAPRPRRTLPVEPLLQLIEERVARYGTEEVARTLGRDARVIRRMRTQRRIHLTTADEYTMALGTTLNLLYE